MLPKSIYIILLVVVLLAPYASRLLARPRRDGSRADTLLFCAIGFGAVVLAAARHGFPVLSVALLLPLAGLGLRSLLGGVAAMLLFSSVTWWTSALVLDAVPSILFVALAIGSASLPRLRLGIIPLTGHPWTSHRIAAPMAVCATVGILAGLLTAPFGAAGSVYLAWHHWGAYLAPVQAWLSGGLPYRDFPVQYGLGPTIVLAAACFDDCWRGTYSTAVVANALYFATLAGCVLILTEARPRPVRWLAILALFCACFLWTGFPVNFAGPLMTPSVAGLRFLTISALLLHILVAEWQDKSRDWLGHLIWLIDLFWSPEAAFFGTVIWWPYLAMRDCGAATTPRDVLVCLVRTSVRGAAVLMFGLVLVAVAAWLLSGRALTLTSFLAYIQHPPGPLPVNPLGTIWIALASIGLAICTIARRGQTSQARSLYACLLGLVAAGTYYLSRSHDNNILNLFPLLVPVLVGLLPNGVRTGASGADFVTGFGQTVLAAMVAFVATFNFGPWAEAAARDGLLELGPQKLVARLAPKPSDAPPILPADAVAGLDYLRNRGAGEVVLVDELALLPRSAPGAGWTGVNNVANFAPLPDDAVAEYIRRGAAAYHRSGWILIGDHMDDRWLGLFKSAYEVRQQRRFGSYSAYYLVPRVG